VDKFGYGKYCLVPFPSLPVFRSSRDESHRNRIVSHSRSALHIASSSTSPSSRQASEKLRTPRFERHKDTRLNVTLSIRNPPQNPSLIPFFRPRKWQTLRLRRATRVSFSFVPSFSIYAPPLLLCATNATQPTPMPNLPFVSQPDHYTTTPTMGKKPPILTFLQKSPGSTAKATRLAQSPKSPRTTSA